MAPLLSSTEESELSRLVESLPLGVKLGQLMQPDWRNFRSFPKLESAACSMLPPLTSSAIKRSLNGPLSLEACSRGLGRHGLGSVLGGGGAAPMPNVPASWQRQSAALQRAARGVGVGLPLLICNDTVHGQANLRDATLFPHHVGQGCMDDPQLVEQLARIAALESHACGINWMFSPCAAVAQDLRWGRAYECFSEDPALAGELAAAEVRGIQRSGVPMAACVKHWVADGGTALGSGKFDMGGIGKAVKAHGIDQGDATLDEDELRRTHIAPYLAPLAEGALTVMASYSSVNGEKCHSSERLITGVLKGELGFEGIVVSDYNAVQQCDKSFEAALVRVLNAGVDVVMTAGGIFGDLSYRKQLSIMEAVVKDGRVPIERIDDAVRRVLRVKMKLGLIRPRAPEGGEVKGDVIAATDAEADDEGRAARRLFAAPDVPEMGDPECVGSAEHRFIARRAVAKSCVLLKNELELLPLTPSTAAGTSDAGAELLVTGTGAHDLGYQCGGWSLEWQGCRGNAFTAGTTLWQAINAERPDATLVNVKVATGRKPKSTNARTASSSVAIVITGEPPYAEGFGDAAELSLPATDARAAAALADAGWSVILVLVSGRPLVLPHELLAKLAGLVAAWLPGTEGTGLADVLFGRTGFSGRLAFSWPKDGTQMITSSRAKDPLFPLGFGLKTMPHDAPSAERA